MSHPLRLSKIVSELATFFLKCSMWQSNWWLSCQILSKSSRGCVGGCTGLGFHFVPNGIQVYWLTGTWCKRAFRPTDQCIAGVVKRPPALIDEWIWVWQQ